MVAWSWSALADALAAGLARAADAIELEQAVRGLDSWRELDLHPVLGGGLRDAGFGVLHEQRFPRDRHQRKRSAGARCDLVVTPDAATPLDEDAPGDALWIEVKVVAQFGEEGPHRGYARALQTPVWGDVRKLARDPAIVHGLVLLVLFTADAVTADHDLDVWCARAVERGLHLWPRVQRALPIGDRLGNRLCTVALFPLDPS